MNIVWRRFYALLGAFIIAAVLAPSAGASNWNVTRMNNMVIPATPGVTISGMSGVTYVGKNGSNYTFIAAMETGAKLVQFDVSLSAAGAITGFPNVTQVSLNSNLSSKDFEGIAYTSGGRKSVYLSDENIPDVREASLRNGGSIATLPTPAVFTNRRDNFGFESLALTRDLDDLWTANEEALTVDGPLSTAADGSVVRLLHFDVSTAPGIAAQQFAYKTDPIHGTVVPDKSRSGLVDLAAMPDGTLLGLERSLAAATPAYKNSIYEISTDGATDVSAANFTAGLIGKTYTPVTKTQLWSGTADGVMGQNLEGLVLGPKLANGSWVLLGVVDADSGDPLSQNTVVAFLATANPTADFDKSGSVDGADLLDWQRGLGITVGAELISGDADRDGDVDKNDLTKWKATVPTVFAAIGAVPEPGCMTLAATALGVIVEVRRRMGR